MENSVENNPKSWREHGRSTVFGLVVLLFGLMLLLRNTEIISRETFHIFFSWEMVIIVIGAMNLFDHKRWFGILLIGVGLLFLMARWYGVFLSLHDVFWPFVFIVGGIFLIFGSARYARHRQLAVNAGDEDFLDNVAIFGGIERTIYSQNFRGGRVTAIFGGSKINLTHATLSPSNNVIELTCIFGGTTLIIPADWNVKLEVVSIFGGFNDKRPPMPADLSKTLILKGVALFGGGELKPY